MEAAGAELQMENSKLNKNVNELVGIKYALQEEIIELQPKASVRDLSINCII